MKGIGCGVMILGIVAIVGCYFVLGDAFEKAGDFEEVAKITLQKEGKTESEIFEVNTERLCQIELKVDLTSRSMEMRPNQFDESIMENHFRYQILFSYRVLDEAGNEIFSEAKTLSSEDTTIARTYSSRTSSDDESEMSITFYLEKFPVEEPGKIKIETELGKDTAYKSELTSAKAVLFENVSKTGVTVFGSLGTICVGVGIIFIGGIIFLIGLFKQKPQVVQEF